MSEQPVHFPLDWTDTHQDSPWLLTRLLGLLAGQLRSKETWQSESVGNRSQCSSLSLVCVTVPEEMEENKLNVSHECKKEIRLKRATVPRLGLKTYISNIQLDFLLCKSV